MHTHTDDNEKVAAAAQPSCNTMVVDFSLSRVAFNMKLSVSINIPGDYDGYTLVQFSTHSSAERRN